MKLMLYFVVMLLFNAASTIEGDKNISTNSLLPVARRRSKRQDNLMYDYPESIGAYDYPAYGNNALAPLSIAGGAGAAGIAVKALKTKIALKTLKLLTLPIGLALLGGLAASIMPPTSIGEITLPFQGKRKKRDTFPFKAGNFPVGKMYI